MTLLEYQDNEVELVIGQLKQQELERVGFQQLTLF